MKLILIPALFLSAAVASAAVASAEPLSPELCSAIGDLAKTTMTVRQAGVPAERLIGLIQGKNLVLENIAKDMVLEAYSEPRYSTESVKQKTISEFQNKYYISCMKLIK